MNRVRARARGARDGLAALVRKTFPAGEVSIEYADAGLYCVVAVECDAGGSSFARASRARASLLSISVTVFGVPMAHLSLKTQLKFLFSMTI